MSERYNQTKMTTILLEWNYKWSLINNTKYKNIHYIFIKKCIKYGDVDIKQFLT